MAWHMTTVHGSPNFPLQASTLTVVNWTMASGNYTLTCKSLGIQAILAWRNSLKSNFTFEINWELFAYVTWKTLPYQFLGLFKWNALSFHNLKADWRINPCCHARDVNISAMLTGYFLGLVPVVLSPSRADEAVVGLFLKCFKMNKKWEWRWNSRTAWIRSVRKARRERWERETGYDYMYVTKIQSWVEAGVSLAGKCFWYPIRTLQCFLTITLA